MIKFKGWNPNLKALGQNQGGGFLITIEASENQWHNLQEINDPKNKNKEFEIILKSKYKNILPQFEVTENQ